VVGDPVVPKEVGVPGADQGIDDDAAGRVVVGVEAVAPPGVVAEEDLGPQPADPERHLGDGLAIGHQIAVDPSEEGHLAGRPQGGGGVALLGLAGGDESRGVGIDVPGALGPVGAHEQ
jgi:hypothetical protein